MGSTTTVPINGLAHDLLDPNDQIVALDLTGNGRSDLLIYRPAGGYAAGYLSRTDGTLTEVPYRVAGVNSHGFMGDLAQPGDCAVPLKFGDNKTGFLWYRPGNYVEGYAAACICQGNGELKWVTYMAGPGHTPQNGFTGDVAHPLDRAVPITFGEGKTGFLWYRPSRGFAIAYICADGDGNLHAAVYRDPKTGNHCQFQGDVLDPRDVAVPMTFGGGKTGFLWCRPGSGYLSAYICVDGSGNLEHVPYKIPGSPGMHGFEETVGNDRDCVVPVVVAGGKTGFLWYGPGAGYATLYVCVDDQGKLERVPLRANGRNYWGFQGDLADTRDRAVPLSFEDGQTGFLWYRPGTSWANAYIFKSDGSLELVPYRDPNNNHNGFRGDVSDDRDRAIPLTRWGNGRKGFLWCRPGAGFATVYFTGANGALESLDFTAIVDMSNWMDGLHEHIKTTPLKDLAIPGSHDAGSYGMVAQAAAQGVDVYAQLASGARYLDLRVIWNKYILKSGLRITQLPIRDEDYYLYHGDFVSDNTMSDVFQQIARFLTDNTREILILDITLHPKQVAPEKEMEERTSVWTRMLDSLKGLVATPSFVRSTLDPTYGGVPPSWNPGLIKTGDLISANRRIIILSNDGKHDELKDLIWYKKLVLDDDYCDKNNVNDLLECLNSKMQQPVTNRLWLLQTQMTPTAADILAPPWVYGYLWRMASLSTPKVVERLASDWSRIPVNIVGGDWIHAPFGGSTLCAAVIRRNGT